jgi:1-phosphofructokinase family hexose kinase
MFSNYSKTMACKLRSKVRDHSMKIQGNIITVGLAPAWDLICQGSHLNWGEHPVLDNQQWVAAGKALNVSRALAWMGRESIASGWWGQDDFAQMQTHLARACPRIETRITPVEGFTRINVTILDRPQHKELHLRAPSSLASRIAFKALQKDLQRNIQTHSVSVLAGALPGASFKRGVLALAQSCLQASSTRLVVDAHGPVFQSLVDAGLPWLIKPNVAELGELLGTTVPNRTASLIKAARTLIHRVPYILISRGRLGAILVTRDQAWQGRCLDHGRVVSTVGCGDTLLAGFLYGLTKHTRPQTALTTGLKVATARAWGWTDQKTWTAARRQIRVEVKTV